MYLDPHENLGDSCRPDTQIVQNFFSKAVSFNNRRVLVMIRVEPSVGDYLIEDAGTDCGSCLHGTKQAGVLRIIALSCDWVTLHATCGQLLHRLDWGLQRENLKTMVGT